MVLVDIILCFHPSINYRDGNKCVYLMCRSWHPLIFQSLFFIISGQSNVNVRYKLSSPCPICYLPNWMIFTIPSSKTMIMLFSWHLLFSAYPPFIIPPLSVTYNWRIQICTLLLLVQISLQQQIETFIRFHIEDIRVDLGRDRELFIHGNIKTILSLLSKVGRLMQDTVS